MSTGSDRGAELRFIVTNSLIVRDIQRSVAFYRDVFGAIVLRQGEPTFLRLGNIWLTINGGGGPTDDKPDVVAGAKFITEPKVHATEIRCYMRDPNGYLIEVGQSTMTADPSDLYK